MILSEKKQTIAQQNGVLVLDKPSGPTSNHCLMAIKRLGQKKIGHAGTLDPMASGVLLVLLGQATKLSGFLLQGGMKVYEATVMLGQESATWDTEGEILARHEWSHVTPEMAADIISSWQGELEQIVPPYSAAKSQGVPLYRLAREGKDVPVKTKTVHIYHTEILSTELPVIRFRVKCSSGTYIRSLAHSLGMRLGCGAVLTALTREYSHPFSLSKSVSLDTLTSAPMDLPSYVRPIEEALPSWPVIHLEKTPAQHVRNGRPVACPPASLDAVEKNNGQALLKDDTGLLALAKLAWDKEKPVLTVSRGLWS